MLYARIVRTICVAAVLAAVSTPAAFAQAVEPFRIAAVNPLRRPILQNRQGGARAD